MRTPLGNIESKHPNYGVLLPLFLHCYFMQHYSHSVESKGNNLKLTVAAATTRMRLHVTRLSACLAGSYSHFLFPLFSPFGCLERLEKLIP